MAKSNYPSSYKSFSKVMLKLQQKELIDALYDPYTAKKHIFLTEKGSEYLGIKRFTKFPITTFIHDSKVVDLVHHFAAEDYINQFSLSYDCENEMVPDATFTRFIDENWPTTEIAFELELTQKSRYRFMDKMDRYMRRGSYDNVIYYFQNKNVLLTYKREFIKSYGKDKLGRFMFLLNDGLFSKQFDFKKTLHHTDNGWKPISGKLYTISEEKAESDRRKEGMAKPVLLPVVQKIAGHANIRTTMKYVHVIGKDIDDVGMSFSLKLQNERTKLSLVNT